MNRRRFCLFCLVAAPLMAGIARAHEAVAGWAYDGECCGGHDCAPVPSTAITETAEGILVVLNPGDHPLVNERIEYPLIPWDATFYRDHDPLATPHEKIIRNVKDGIDPSTHICLYPGTKIRCIYRGARQG